VNEIQSRQDAVNAVHAAVFKPRVTKKTASTSANTNNTNGTGKATPRDDADLLRLARNAANGAKFTALYDRADYAAAGQPSLSECDLALCNMLAFWTGRDAAHMDSLYRCSALHLGREDKWERVGPSTIDKAIADCAETYRGTHLNGGPELTPEADDVIADTLAKFSGDHSLAFSIGFLDAVATVGVTDPQRLDRIYRQLKEKHFTCLTDFKHEVRERQQQKKREQRQGNAAKSPPSGAYIIERSDQYQLIASQAFGALKAANNPIRLVSYADFMTRVDDTIITSLTPDSLRDELTKAVDWLDTKFNPSRPSADFAKLMLAGVKSPLPEVRRFARSPIFTNQGSLIVTPGYHSSSQIFLLPHGFDLGVIPENPTAEEVKASRELLLEMIIDFPFEGDSDRANALALPFERLMREMIRGPLPINLFDGTTPGCGKGLLTRGLLGITNTPVAAWPEVENDAEMRKALTTFFMEGAEVVLIDNVKHKIKSGALALATTEPEWIDRLLSLNRKIVVKILNSWVMTANNPALEKEFLRRCNRIRLAPKTEHPENRPPSVFKHPDLLGWCADRRNDLLRALIILAQNWIAKGKLPPQRVPSLGSYESWSAVIGGILESAGIEDFQANRGQFETDAGDFETEVQRELIAQWWLTHNDGQVLSKTLFSIAETVDGFPLKGEDEKAQRISFGITLRGLNGRVFTLKNDDDSSIDLEVVRIPVKLHSAALWQLKLIPKVIISSQERE
jgi:hypothetical protein